MNNALQEKGSPFGLPFFVKVYFRRTSALIRSSSKAVR